jgi:hypothetical protein
MTATGKVSRRRGAEIMSNHSGFRDLLWSALLGADLSGRYFGRLTVRYQRWDRGAKILIALTASTSVSGWAVWGTPGLDWVWKVLSATSAVVAVALPIIDPTTSLKATSNLKGAWVAILKDYELLWSELPMLSEQSAYDAYQRIMNEEKKLGELEAVFPRSRRLILDCQDEVCRARGLEGRP